MARQKKTNHVWPAQLARKRTTQRRNPLQSLSQNSTERCQNATKTTTCDLNRVDLRSSFGTSTHTGTVKPINPKHPISRRLLALRSPTEDGASSSTYGVGSGKGGCKRLRKVLVKRSKSAAVSFKDLKQLDDASLSKNSIAMKPFSLVVRQILQEVQAKRGLSSLRIQLGAIEALRDTSVSFLLSLFEDCQMLVVHSRRVTLMVRDLQLATKLRIKNQGVS